MSGFKGFTCEAWCPLVLEQFPEQNMLITTDSFVQCVVAQISKLHCSVEKVSDTVLGDTQCACYFVSAVVQLPSMLRQVLPVGFLSCNNHGKRESRTLS